MHIAVTFFGQPLDIGFAWRAVVFAVLLLGAVGSLVIDFRRGRRLGRRGDRVQGTVTGRLERRDDSGRRTFRAVVRFVARDGREVEATMPNETVHPVRRGSRVPVVYDPENPEEARIDRLWQRGPFASAFFIVALLLFLAGWGWVMFTGVKP